MERLYLNDYLSGLQRQISASVERLKSRRTGDGETVLQEGAEGQAASPRHELYQYAFGLLDGRISYELSRYSSSAPLNADSGYAVGSYQQAAEVDRPPSVIIDFMFEYNREFDFKV